MKSIIHNQFKWKKALSSIEVYTESHQCVKWSKNLCEFKWQPNGHQKNVSLMEVNELKLEEDLFKEVLEIEKDNCGRVKFKMSDPYSNEAPADRDEEMEAFDISSMALSFEAAGIIGVCSTVIIGNGLLSVLSFRKPSQSYTGNTSLLFVAVTDMFTAIITMPLMVASLLELKWKYGDVLCKATGVLTMLFLFTSLMVLCLVLLHRCWIVFCSNQELESMARKQTLIFMVVVVLAIAIASLAFLINWKRFLSNPTRLLCRLTNSPNYIAYRMYYCIFSMITPLLIIILLLNRKPQPATWI